MRFPKIAFIYHNIQSASFDSIFMARVQRINWNARNIKQAKDIKG